MEMQDRTVIVTGGASGIGKATALLLAREGARVFVGDIDEAGGAGGRGEAAGEGLALEFLPLDLTKTESIAGFAAAVQQRVERVDGLVNGAGWDRIQPFMENPPEMWDQLIAINLLGAVRLTRAVLPPMVEARRRQDRQHFERCRAGRQHRRDRLRRGQGRPHRVHQIAGARIGAVPYKRQLRVPRPDRHAAVPAQPERMREALTRAIPFRRIAQPEEIAEAVMFFLGRRSDYITGQVLSVSGGLTMVE